MNQIFLAPANASEFLVGKFLRPNIKFSVKHVGRNFEEEKSVSTTFALLIFFSKKFIQTSFRGMEGARIFGDILAECVFSPHANPVDALFRTVKKYYVTFFLQKKKWETARTMHVRKKKPSRRFDIYGQFAPIDPKMQQVFFPQIK